MAEVRPDPDQLLERVKAEEARKRRGRLRIFFGASAGVGKTYAMLEAARSAVSSGTDVVVGYVEPHGRLETERLLEGLPRLPPLPVNYRGIVRLEFDLDAALARHPEILLVDELAHSNLTGGEPAPRHPKRWQDVAELLAEGISVWTTVNVQHLESLNDLILQTTGVRQRETLPDHVFDEADDIELIDLPPDDLIARLRAGKVYVAEGGIAAVERFFRKQNLMALREIALRRVADRVEAASRALPPDRLEARIAGDRVLVAVGPDEQAEQLVRAGKRMADALDAEWIVVYVETPALLRLSRSRTQPAHRGAASRRVPRRPERDARRSVGSHDARRVCARAQRHPRHRRRTETARLARVAAALDRHRAGAAGARLRRGADRLGAPGSGAARCSGHRAAAGHRGALGPLRLGAGDHRSLHAARVRDVPAFRSVQPRHDLPARGDRGGAATRTRTVGADRAAECRGVRFLLRAAALLVRGLGCAVPGHLRRHADHRAGHRHAHRERATADARGGRARAAHRAAVCHEPRTGSHARHRQHGARGGTPRRGSVRSPGGGAAARGRRQAALPDRPAARELVSSRGSRGGAVGRRSRSPRRTRLRYAAGVSRAVRAARRRAAHGGSAGGAGEQRAARAAARAEPPARHLRRADRTRPGARPPGGSGGSLEPGRRARDAAQHAARVHLPRSAHAARGDRRRRQHARAARRQSRRSDAGAAGALGGDQGARDVGAGHERSRAGAPGIGPGGAAARLADAR